MHIWHIHKLWLRTRFGLVLFLPLLWTSCYTSPFREHKVFGWPKDEHRYYALHVYFAPELQQYFQQRGCNYNSVESWTVYFSRDPQSYSPQNYAENYTQGYTLMKRTQLPSFWLMKKISDLKLFLPRGAYMPDTYRKTEFYGNFPVITSETARNYSLSRLEQAAIEELQRGIWPAVNTLQQESAEPQELQESPEAQEIRLKELPQVVNEKGLVRQRQIRSKDREARKKRKVQRFISHFSQPYRLLQRARSGPRFLNYLLMVGVTATDKEQRSSRWELWDLPVVLPDSAERFQYLGELEIGLTARSAAAGKLLFNYLGQAELRFQVNDQLRYWKPYLDRWLSGPRLQENLEDLGGKRAGKPTRPEYLEEETRPQADFTANLLQVVDREIFQRHFPYARFEFGDNPECRF